MTVKNVTRSSPHSFLFLTISVLFWLCLSPTPGHGEDGGEKILARVGDQLITEADLDHVMKALRVQGDFMKAMKTHTEEGRQEILDGMIETLLLCRGAQRDGFLETEEMEIKIRWALAQLVAEEYVKRKLFADRPPEKEMRSFYEGHRERYTKPPEVKVRHIVVAKSALAESLMQALGEGASFEELAEANNTDATKNRGGLMGWIKPGVAVGPFEQAAFSLEVGATSGIVKTQFGFHILRVEDRREGRVKPFEQVRKDVLKAMREERLEGFKNELKETWEVTIYR
jgi:peptidyl-prolyl cis-trans isomerase C